MTAKRTEVNMTADEEQELSDEKTCYNDKTCSITDGVKVSRMLHHLIDGGGHDEAFLGQLGDLVANFMPHLSAGNVAFEDFTPMKAYKEHWIEFVSTGCPRISVS